MSLSFSANGLTSHTLKHHLRKTTAPTAEQSHLVVTRGRGVTRKGSLEREESENPDEQGRGCHSSENP